MQPSSGNGSTTHGDGSAVEEMSVTPNSVTPNESASARYFPQTLVAMDPPTLPAASLTAPPPEFRQFPAPQRSEPGHPRLRDTLRRILLFWRSGA